MRTNTTWLRFRAGEDAHAIAGIGDHGQGPNLHLYLTACGMTFHRTTGEQDHAARRCGLCERALLSAEVES